MRLRSPLHLLSQAPRADACQMVVALTPLFLLKKMYSK